MDTKKFLISGILLGLLTLLFIYKISTRNGDSDQTNTNALYYENHGAYVAKVRVHWTHDDTGYHTQWLASVDEGYIMVAALPDKTTCNLYPCNGDEVWFEVDIEAGDDISCQKSEPFIADNTSEWSSSFKTAGTTLNDNHCQIIHKQVQMHCPHNDWPQKTAGCSHTTP